MHSVGFLARRSLIEFSGLPRCVIVSMGKHGKKRATVASLATRPPAAAAATPAGAAAAVRAAEPVVKRAREHADQSAAPPRKRLFSKATQPAAAAPLPLHGSQAPAKAARGAHAHAVKAEEEEEEDVPMPSSSGRAAAAAPVPGAHQSDVRFADLKIHPLTKKVMAEVFRYELCTKVQAQTIGPCLSGADVLAKAKTGSGKTLAFSIPAIENLVSRPQRRGQVGVLVLSPTRELAMQIFTEMEKLLDAHGLTAQVAIGGTNIASQNKRLEQRVPDVLVATPGRCLDLLSNNGLARMVKELRVLVLDEADNILDMGFRPTINDILRYLPDKTLRQTLLFSATFPKDVQELATYAFRPTYKVVDTVGQENNTNVQVEQFQCVVPHPHMMLYLANILRNHIKQDPKYKVIVFFPTARMTQLYAETFQHMNVGKVLEIHSRKSQGYRTRVSDEFRQGVSVCMFSSDVSARGVDYPNVSLVVQVGLPTDKDQYVHRVGRTARAGRAGEAVLLLADFEGRKFTAQLKGLPVETMPELPPAVLDAETTVLDKALAKVDRDTKEKAYVAWLGFYKSSPFISLAAAQLVDVGNAFSKIIGLPEPPEIEAKTVGKMGLKGVPGIRVAGKGSGGGPGRAGGGGGGGEGQWSQQGQQRQRNAYQR